MFFLAEHWLWKLRPEKKALANQKKYFQTLPTARREDWFVPPSCWDSHGGCLKTWLSVGHRDFQVYQSLDCRVNNLQATNATCSLVGWKGVVVQGLTKQYDEMEVVNHPKSLTKNLATLTYTVTLMTQVVECFVHNQSLFWFGEKKTKVCLRLNITSWRKMLMDHHQLCLIIVVKMKTAVLEVDFD